VRPWTEADVKLLGRLSDREVVERTGHSLKGVQTKGQGMGILVRPHGRPWTAKEDRLLGTKPDSELATLLKRTRITVYWRPFALGMKPAVQRPPQWKWTPTEDKFLGAASDAVIGRRLDRSGFSVQLRRLRLKLPSHRERKGRSYPR